ncbi:threonine aldolase family protein [Microbacterium halophytorum]|uniref:threonine aldolase family protein n=1 Tax=Microbacterium halophytorum TaxID=2067568 RepID=UPI000CFD5567|nr:aminotransferase class I/II-fold pyridoxal phosphate-dependent enzyme [Microbacterium halophytorum]
MIPLHDPAQRGFASDNYSGIHPEVLEAIAAANGGHQSAYGYDAYTDRLREVIRGHFGDRAEAFPVFNGTGANVVALQSMLPRWGAVIAPQTAHINTDEGAAPERVAGIKLLPFPTVDGKLTPAHIDEALANRLDEHNAQPRVVSITQSTELGTLYTADEIRAIADRAHAAGLTVHMDGSRIANAAAALGAPLREFTTDAGVDVLSLGGTKNGALAAEAIVAIDPDAADGLIYLRKFDMQLASKMRFVSAQLLALYDGDLFLRSAAHANAMAARLRDGLNALIGAGAIAGVSVADGPVNGVFATLPEGVADRLRDRFHFYDWDASRGEVRWMCSFDTTESDIDALVAAVAAETAA